MALQSLKYTYMGVPFSLNANFPGSGDGGGFSPTNGPASSVYGRFADTDGAASYKQANIDGTFMGFKTIGGLDFYTPPSGGGSYTPPDWLVQLDPTKLQHWRGVQLSASLGGGLVKPANILIIGDSTAQPAGDNWFTSPDWPAMLRRLMCTVPNLQVVDPNAPTPFVGHGLIWQSEAANTTSGAGWTQNPIQQAGRGYGPCGGSGVRGTVGTATGVTTWVAPYLHTGIVKIYFTCETVGANCDVVYAGATRFTITPTSPGVIQSIDFDMDVGTAAVGIGSNNGAEFQPPTGTTGADVTIVAIEYAPDGFRGLSGGNGSWYQLTNGALGGQSVQTFMYDGGVSYTQMVDLIQPDLTIIALTTNDSRDDLPPHTYYTDGLNFMCDAAQVYGDVIFMTGPPTQNLTATQVLYQAKVKEIADAQNSNFVNMIAKYGSWDVANANGYMVDFAHTTPIGSADSAFTLFKALFSPCV